ncbi:MAG: hypothetical protein M1826_003583 [Phylliscum demangeonii]|nr:MAG: hypothetical protein M1826_003583 [Phylliscum demangeonii]
MATLNLSSNGPSIAKSYQTVINAPPPSGPAASSPTYGQWAIYSVSAPLVNAFQKDSSGKESILKVQSTGEGELESLVDEFSDGRIQFAFAKVRDPNSGLPKNVLLGWCGEGVPERTKGYYPAHLAAVGKVLRAQQDGPAKDDRPSTVKGAYEPVGKVDIAAIRARAQPPSTAGRPSPVDRGEDDEATTAPISTPSERLTSLPRPRVGNSFAGGSSTGSIFSGTKAPAPVGLSGQNKPPPPAAPIGSASRTFADQGGKTPAQLWAEKKARNGGLASAAIPSGPTSPLVSQQSGGGEWKSGYSGKSWAAVRTTDTGRSGGSGSGGSVEQHHTGQEDDSQEEPPPSSAGGIAALRDRFSADPPMGAPRDISSAPSPPLNPSMKPNAGTRSIPVLPGRPDDEQGHEHEAATTVRIPTPPAVPRSATPPTPPAVRSSSPIRVAMPVSRSKAIELDPPDERFAPPPVPGESLARAAMHEAEVHPDPPPASHDPGRAAAEAAAAATFGKEAVAHAAAAGGDGGKRALIQFDYEKAEDNEIDLVEGQLVTNIDFVDDDWWMGQNSQGESGLFPSNYVELVEDGHGGGTGGAGHASAPAAEQPQQPQQHQEHGQEATPSVGAAGTSGAGPSATALFDYEAAEANELSFAEGEKITGVEFPDEDWWFGHLGAKEGLFPANYVQLDE